MRLRIVYYRPEWMKKQYQPNQEQREEAWNVTFEGNFVAPARYEVVADVHIERGSEDDQTILDNTFRNTQNDFFPNGWRQTLVPGFCGVRSSMIGDLFALDDKWYIVARTGFTPLTPEQTAAAETIR